MASPGESGGSVKKSRGHLIVVEGLDRSGKTTQCQTLCEAIRDDGKNFKYVKFPDRTTATGQMINAYLQGTAEQSDEAIHLLFSANRWEAAPDIVKDLEAGTTIVIDRYSFSGGVYSAAKENPNMSLEWCWNPEIGLPKPDMVMFLDISSEDAAKRGGYGEERYEKEEMQNKVRHLFQGLFRRLGKLLVIPIMAGRSQTEVANDMSMAYQALVKVVPDTAPLARLSALTEDPADQRSSSLSSMTTSSISAIH